MRPAEYIKLLHRAWKYRYITDRYEIACMMKRISRSATVMDIGAHKGGYTFWMQKATGAGGKIIAFEPQEKGAALLRELFPGITVERMAVSDSCSNRSLYIQPQSYAVSFEASLDNRYAHAHTESISCTTLDAYCSSHQLQPQFIKIDVEGHELAVLQGARELLARYHPVLLVECEQRHAGAKGRMEVFSLLASAGYKGWFFLQKKKLPLSHFDPSIHQLAGQKVYVNNFLFEQ
jgi:FkbM family methyltransferase